MDMQIIFDGITAVRNIFAAFFLSWIRFFFSGYKKKSVTEEIVLITGAGSGMGQGMAMEFAKLGAVVVLWDVNNKGLEETVKMVKAVEGVCHTYICDVSDRAAVRETADKVRSEVGDVTMLVNSAGVVAGRRLLDLTDQQIEHTFGVNLMGPIWTTKEFLPSMLENNQGHIVNMASSCGLIGLSHLTDYSASKFGVVGFTQTLNYEIHFSGHDGVHTTLVCPSFVTTGMFQGCRMAFPLLIPELEQNATVQRIMHAILTNQSEVYIPRLVYFMNSLKTIIPVSAMLEVIRFFRADKFMHSFVGRGKDELSLPAKEE
ncbi:epidermal retinol dehydrogenase 2 [Aplysia californica]|uniref:Epidermal retinol dehydrogenase 2 n=1 Tax=Aplysia californica TaxID=6500 RepID=A0ABM1A8C8_APLCA|nr:epidermal retinol dehydrogenase 2 [Aplysia californica]XP_035827969.1 epidermal retinol dehydrogenase 2 [Aplysia californica]XP_035827970.1 epidermal retinol dehydrogenase 2 [Aplysia californica]XP_035827971.1 epidermal retinol dehydrogenase 2 [Aplysia californica]XP_035827972.1 epidermal retinol dehydrogenase 2 [Aplysia californica]XP_035827973.1 epidermal retinol dehydrogenase 2 [Aplysia californica]XP_035827974.1 epidermal retinol dehydrogenase 2 [Aplysia californica]XP_035827975.1 epi